MRDSKSKPLSPVTRRRVAVVGEFRLIVEAVSRSLPLAFRPVPVVIDECSPTNPLRDAALRGRADLVVLVTTVQDTTFAPDLVSALAARGQPVVVTGHVGDPAMSIELVAAGASAVLDGHGIAELTQVVERLAARGTAARVPVLTRLPDSALTGQHRARRNLGRLTPAEARTLWRLMHGSSVSDIARIHVVSVETVRSHIRALLTKLGASSQLAAVCLAWDVGWHPAPAVLVAA